jgi:hypothetical protein
MAGCGAYSPLPPPDPALHLRVRVGAMSVNAANEGSSWDADLSPPDPLVRVTCPGTDPEAVAIQPEVSNAFEPRWATGGCVALTAQLQANPVLVSAVDADVLANDLITPEQPFWITDDRLGEAQRNGSASFTTAATGSATSLVLTIELVR